MSSVYTRVKELLPKVEGRLPFKNALIKLHARAHRFSLCNQFVENITHLKFSDIGEGKDFTKLPANPCWLEEEFIYRDVNSKTGVLVWTPPDKPEDELFRFVVFILHSDGTVAASSPSPISFSVVKHNDSYAIELKFSRQHDEELANDKQRLNSIELFGCYAGFSFILMNQKRFVSVKTEDYEKLNKIRAKNGQDRLPAFSVVKLADSVRRDIDAQNKYIAANGSHRRLHFRRGHFKLLKDGQLHWWSPHFAGSAELGVKDKEYAV